MLNISETNGVIKSLVSTAYQLQKMRISTGLRIVNNYKIKNGQEPGARESELTEEAKNFLDRLRLDTIRVSDIMAEKVTRNSVFPGVGLVTNEGEYCLSKTYLTLLEEEENTFKAMGNVLKNHPMMPWFNTVKGIGPAIAAVLISEVDMNPERTPNLGSLYAYCGLDTVVEEVTMPNGEAKLVGVARSRQDKHLVMRQYTARDGSVKERKSITYNEFLHTKLLGVCADNLIRSGGYFKTEVYNNYKFRLLNSPDHVGKNGIHIERMAKRYVIKIFMMYFFEEYCRVIGRELPPLYHERKLNLHHSGPLFTGDVKKTEAEKEIDKLKAEQLKAMTAARKKERDDGEKLAKKAEKLKNKEEEFSSKTEPVKKPRKSSKPLPPIKEEAPKVDKTKERFGGRRFSVE